jgi:hypothetical protein
MAAALPPLERDHELLTGSDHLCEKCNTRFSGSVLCSLPNARFVATLKAASVSSYQAARVVFLG